MIASVRRRRGAPDITVETASRHTAEVRGNRAIDVIKLAGCPHQFLYQPPSGGAPCWAVPVWAVGDVEAAAATKRGNCNVVTTLWDVA